MKVEGQRRKKVRGMRNGGGRENNVREENMSDEKEGMSAGGAVLNMGCS